jgi:uncharacterized protein DUF5677
MTTPDYVTLGAIPKKELDKLLELHSQYRKDREAEDERRRQEFLDQNAPGFKLFDMNCAIASYIGRALYQRFLTTVTEGLKPGDTRSSAFDTVVGDRQIQALQLILLQAKACTIAEEVRLLLMSGFAEAAAARLRSLHECLVFCLVIAKDRDGLLAVRLHDAATLERWDHVRALAKYEHKVPWARVDPEELRELEESRQLVTEKWGERLREDYEWARPIVNKVETKPVTLRDLELAVGIGERRAVYRLFTQDVHISSTTLIDELFKQPQYGASFSPKAPPFLAISCMTMISDITLTMCTSLEEHLDGEYEVRLARGLEFLSQLPNASDEF